MHKLMDQNQQLLLNTQAENQRLLSLQESSPEGSQNVHDGDFTDDSTKSSTQDKKRPQRAHKSNLGTIKISLTV